MSLTASILEPWLLVTNDVGLRSVKHVENDTEAKKVKGWLEQADHFVVTQKRHFVGLTHFDPDTGDEKSTFSWYVGNGSTLTFIRTLFKGPGNKYVCTKDRLEILDHVTGEGWETQVWEYQSKFEPVAGSYYEEEAT